MQNASKMDAYALRREMSAWLIDASPIRCRRGRHAKVTIEWQRAIWLDPLGGRTTIRLALEGGDC